jgi:hypothetical protein
MAFKPNREAGLSFLPCLMCPCQVFDRVSAFIIWGERKICNVFPLQSLFPSTNLFISTSTLHLLSSALFQPKIKLEREGFLWLTLPYCCSSSKGVRTGTQTRQGPGGRSCCRGQGGMLLTGLLPLAYSTCFSLKHKTTTYSGMGLALPHLIN